MNYAEFTINDVEDYLNQQLPGFEPNVLRDERTHGATLRVRSKIQFGAYQTLSDELLFPLHGGYQLKAQIDELVRRTRNEMIDKLGLQKEIDAEVQRKLSIERQALEAKAFKEAYEKALATVAKSMAENPSLDAIRVFMNEVKP